LANTWTSENHFLRHKHYCIDIPINRATIP